MRGIIGTTVITVILISLFELLLPRGNIKKVAASIMGIIAMAMILTPILNYFNQASVQEDRVYVFEERGE